ncbi:MAG: hypothetical protein ACHRHE_09105 [Tepidisphaerales bacterium]
MRYLLLLVAGVCLSGCTGAFGVGGEDGVGLKSSVGMDGKIVEIAPADGNGDPK